MTTNIVANGLDVQSQNLNGDFSKSNHNLKQFNPALSILVKEFWGLYKQYDCQDPMLATPINGDDGIVDTFHALGTDKGDILLWAFSHPFKFMLEVDPLIPSKYQDIGGVIHWEAMVDDIGDELIRLSLRIDNDTAINWLEKLEPVCKDEAELLKVSQRVKRLLLSHHGWENVIKPFQKRLSNRLWDERKQPTQTNPDPNGDRLKAEELKINIKAYLQEKDPAMRAVLKQRFVKDGISNQTFDQLVKAIGNQTTTLRCQYLSADDFRKTVSVGSKWLIPGLINATGVTLLTAPAGGSKSTFAFDLAGSIIDGKEFMGETIKENGFVIFACSDEPFEESQERAMLQGFIQSDNFAFLRGWTVNQMEALEQAIENDRPKLVIVDSFDSINSGAGIDENSTQASQCIKDFTALSDKYSCAFVLLHHENKDPNLKGVNKARGSTAIVASANGHIRIMGGAEGENDQPSETGLVSKIVKIEKLRGGETRSIQCNVDYYNVRFEPVVDLEFEQSKDKRQTILNFLQRPANSGKFFEVSELNKYLGWEGKGIYRYLKQLGDRGEISRKPNQMGRKGMVYGYIEPDLTEDESLARLAQLAEIKPEPITQPEPINQTPEPITQPEPINQTPEPITQPEPINQTPEPDILPVGSLIIDSETNSVGVITGITNHGYLTDMGIEGKPVIPFNAARLVQQGIKP